VKNRFFSKRMKKLVKESCKIQSSQILHEEAPKIIMQKTNYKKTT